MIIGIGVDLVDVARFERAASRTPKLVDRLFAQSEQAPGEQAPGEQNDPGQETDDRRLPLRSLAARFAAKEALIKAIGDSTGVRWHDMRVVSNELRNPSFELTGRVAEIAAERGITSIHLSMSHDAGLAIAYVIVEGES